MKVEYRPQREFPGWSGAEDFLRSKISQFGATRILEVGSGADPTLSPEYVAAGTLEYTTNDISEAELARARPVYHKLKLDLCDGTLPAHLHGHYQLVFSRMVNEHVRDGRKYFENIHRLLQDGGITIHCYSTLYSLPFVANRLFPEEVADRLLEVVAPRQERRHGKFRAYYSWSRGPTRRAIGGFESLGYEVLEYVGFFGHNYYRRIPPLDRLEQLKARVLLKHPNPYLTSYAYVVLRRPQSSGSMPDS